MYLKYFQKVSVDSYYNIGEECWHRTFDFGHNQEIIENEKTNYVRIKILLAKQPCI